MESLSACKSTAHLIPYGATTVLQLKEVAAFGRPVLASVQGYYAPWLMGTVFVVRGER